MKRIGLWIRSYLLLHRIIDFDDPLSSWKLMMKNEWNENRDRTSIYYSCDRLCELYEIECSKGKPVGCLSCSCSISGRHKLHRFWRRVNFLAWFFVSLLVVNHICASSFLIFHFQSRASRAMCLKMPVVGIASGLSIASIRSIDHSLWHRSYPDGLGRA